MGDSGYPLKKWLFTPVFDNGRLTDSEEHYNRAHRSARSCVERTIGVLKRRWACLKMGLRFSTAKCCRVITACVVLHNLATLLNEPEPHELMDDDEDAVVQRDEFNEGMNRNDIDGQHARTEFILNNFA